MLQIVTVTEKVTGSVEYASVVSTREAANVLCDHIEKLLDRKFFRVQITPADPEIIASITEDMKL